jgi:hypothetical protein
MQVSLCYSSETTSVRKLKLPEVAGSDFRLNRGRRNEIANIRSYQVTISFVWFKEARVIARGNKNARIMGSGVFIYG